MSKTVEKKHVGLEVGHIVAKYLFDSEDLHYGDWSGGLEPCVRNFPQAQRRYSERILENLPDGVRTVLDVGGGAGTLARKLQDRGLEVEVVVPSAYLAGKCREKLREGTPVHECTLQDFAPGRTFDLLVFSESFQYIPVAEALDACESLLAPGGHLLLFDCFKENVPGRCPIKGGIRRTDFDREMPRRPFREVLDLDLTEAIAPSFDVFADMLQNLALPLGSVVAEHAQSQYPWVTRLVRWKLRPRIDKLQRRYFSGDFDGAAFRKWKSYRLMVFQRT
jgi:SAM-dependent methyltransferase